MKTNRIAIDIFAETNPAFCALIIFYFCKGHINETKDGVPFPLIILPLPIILSNDLSKTFEGTNVRTGFFRWIENNPGILLDLSQQINDSNEYLRPAIEFGLFKRIFEINDFGFLTTKDDSLRNRKTAELDYLFKFSERFGHWIGQVNSPKTIYNHLGLQL